MEVNTQNVPSHGEIIALLLNNQSRNQTWLAQKCNCTQGFISQVINGLAIPSLQTALRMSAALNTPVEQIFFDLF